MRWVMKVGSVNLDQKWSVTINITRLIFLHQSQAMPEGNSKAEAMDERVIWQGQLSSVILLTFEVNSPDLAGWLRVISIRPHYPMGTPFWNSLNDNKNKEKRDLLLPGMAIHSFKKCLLSFFYISNIV